MLSFLQNVPYWIIVYISCCITLIVFQVTGPSLVQYSQLAAYGFPMFESGHDIKICKETVDMV